MLAGVVIPDLWNLNAFLVVPLVSSDDRDVVLPYRPGRLVPQKQIEMK